MTGPPFDHGIPPNGEGDVVVERRELRSIYRGVLVVLALVVLTVLPLGVSQLAQRGTNDQLRSHSARIEEQADQLADLVDENRAKAELAIAQQCVASHRGYSRFSAFMGQVRDAVVLADAEEFDRLLQSYPQPTCDLAAAEAEVERLERSASAP